MKRVLYFLFAIFLINLNSGFSDVTDRQLETPKIVVLTGAAGFIGSNFLEYMFDRHPEYNYVVLDALTYAGNLDNISKSIQEAPNFKFIHGSVTNVTLVEEIMKTATYVVHFAAETHVTRSIADDYVFFETDVLGTRALMEALVNHSKTVERFVHISTSEVYGTAEYQPMDENHPLKARSPYAAAKVGADRLVYAYGSTYDVPVVIIRPFNNYGPRQHLEKMIPRFITSAIQGKPLTLHNNGVQSRDWIHTNDVAVALDKVLHIPDFSKIKNQEINIGTGVAISVLDIAKMILKEFDLPESYLKYVGDRPGQVDCHISSTNKSKEVLDWQSSIDIKEGLKMTIDWYKQNPEYWEKLIDNSLIEITNKNGECELQ